MQTLGEDLSLSEIDEMMKEADRDGDGSIDCASKRPRFLEDLHADEFDYSRRVCAYPTIAGGSTMMTHTRGSVLYLYHLEGMAAPEWMPQFAARVNVHIDRLNFDGAGLTSNVKQCFRDRPS